jgi:putative FmdB family regulatory protein
MPIYEYECTKCGKLHEIMQKMTDKPLTECTECGGKMKKMISNTSFVLKGTGWYATDYAAGKSPSGGSKTEKAADTKSENKTDSKTEAKAEKKSPTEAAASK